MKKLIIVSALFAWIVCFSAAAQKKIFSTLVMMRENATMTSCPMAVIVGTG